MIKSSVRVGLFHANCERVCPSTALCTDVDKAVLIKSMSRAVSQSELLSDVYCRCKPLLFHLCLKF